MFIRVLAWMITRRGRFPKLAAASYNDDMPAYPYPPDPDARPGDKARLRAGLTRGLARLVRGDSGYALTPKQLESARILIIRPDHLGDLLFLGPAMRWLRARLPEAHIALAIGPWGKPALPGLAGTYDELIEIPFPAFERGLRANTVQRWELLFRWAKRLKSGDYDAALIARPDHWWGAMLARFAGIPQRLGFDTPETAPWLTQTLPAAHEHAATSNLRLVAALTGDALHPDPTAHPLRFHLTPRDLGDADKLLFDIFGVDDVHPLAVIHPGSGAAIKLWEPEKWREIARRLADAGVRVLVTGGPDETELTRTVAAVPSGNVVDVGGQTSFATLAALLYRADIALGPDSGPLHLAVAAGTPTVHLYGPADPALFGPWGDPARHIVIQSDWDCAPCGKFDWPDLPAHACVRDIPVDGVWAATRLLLPDMV
jgi:heptosyltransferase-2/heptosyltransferase-3